MFQIREVKVRYGKKKHPTQIKAAHDIAEFVRKKVIRENNKEHLIGFFLDGNHDIVAYNLIGIGTANTALVHPREVFQPALIVGAVSVILVHNHPSGNVEPSSEDIVATQKMIDAANVLGVKFLDHIIVTEDRHISLAERGFVTDKPKRNLIG